MKVKKEGAYKKKTEEKNIEFQPCAKLMFFHILNRTISLYANGRPVFEAYFIISKLSILQSGS